MKARYIFIPFFYVVIACQSPGGKVQRSEEYHSIQDNINQSLITYSKEGKVDKVRQALNNGADVNHQDMIKMSALMWASINDRIEVVRALLAAGANVNHQDNTGFTALMYASREGHIEILRLLKEAGATK